MNMVLFSIGDGPMVTALQSFRLLEYEDAKATHYVPAVYCTRDHQHVLIRYHRLFVSATKCGDRLVRAPKPRLCGVE